MEAAQVGAVAGASAWAGAEGAWQQGPLRVAGAAEAGASVDAMALARGAIVRTRTSLSAAGRVLAEAVARTQARADASAAIGKELLRVDGHLATDTMAGAEAGADAMAYMGIDELGLPAVEIGGSAQGATGVRAEGTAGATVSFLGLFAISVRAIAEGIAGAAGGAMFHLKARNGDFALQLGATGAAGVGGHVGTEVGVQLGPIPEGLIMATVSPIVELPELAVSSLARLVGLDRKHPGPGLSDYPAVAGRTIATGAKLIAKGAVQVAGDFVGAVRFVGHLF